MAFSYCFGGRWRHPYSVWGRTPSSTADDKHPQSRKLGEQWWDPEGLLTPRRGRRGGEHRWLRTDEHRGGENNVKNTSDDNQCKGPELTVKDTDRPETNGRPRGVLFT